MIPDLDRGLVREERNGKPIDEVDAALAAALECSLRLESDPDVFAGFNRALKRAVDAGHLEPAAAALRSACAPTRDYTSMQTLLRAFRRLRGRVAPAPQSLRLAVLSSFTISNVIEMVELFLFAGGVDLTRYEADYGLIHQEVLDGASGLYQFAPRAVFVATTWRDLTRLPHLDDDAATVAGKVAAERADWAALWKTMYDRLGCQVIQNNFDRPAWRQLGNHEQRHAGSMGQFVGSVNRALADEAPAYVTVHDVDALSAEVGRRTWNDERYYQHAKLPCAPECLVEYAHSVASVLLAQLGLSKKCLVLDLDNTLWGGVIGDDGLGGVRLGQGDSEGESFLAFQRYCLALRQRGVILAVCSKNTDAVAREMFEKHPEMVLRMSDVSCFVANWDDKATNIRAIARTLNIGVNSLVFIDDNPAERSIIRQLVPDVAVPEVTTDPLDYIRALEQGRYFQSVGIGSEDLQRTAMYQANEQRLSAAAAAATSADSLEAYLRSLEMVARVGPISDVSLERSAQLINKSNQFNLTTVRRSAAELLAIAKDPSWITYTVSLKDRFGDNGLISVLLGQVSGGTVEIDTWLMSCRVLKRNVERSLLDVLCGQARKRGLTIVRGRYIPTSKNALVKDHYTALGFECVETLPTGECTYELRLDVWTPSESVMELKEER